MDRVSPKQWRMRLSVTPGDLCRLKVDIATSSDEHRRPEQERACELMRLPDVAEGVPFVEVCE